MANFSHEFIFQNKKFSFAKNDNALQKCKHAMLQKYTISENTCYACSVKRTKIVFPLVLSNPNKLVYSDVFLLVCVCVCKCSVRFFIRCAFALSSVRFLYLCFGQEYEHRQRNKSNGWFKTLLQTVTQSYQLKRRLFFLPINQHISIHFLHCMRETVIFFVYERMHQAI